MDQENNENALAVINAEDALQQNLMSPSKKKRRR